MHLSSASADQDFKLLKSPATKPSGLRGFLVLKAFSAVSPILVYFGLFLMVNQISIRTKLYRCGVDEVLSTETMQTG